MDDKAQAKAHKEALEQDIRVYKKLRDVKKSEELNTFMDLLIKTAAEKMMWVFTAGKDGDNVKNWDDFVKVRGEIIAYLYPIQEIHGADAMVKHLQMQFEKYYGEPKSQPE